MGKSYIRTSRNLFFRRWCNKSYAAFNSIGRVVKICTLISTYVLLSRPSFTFAQADTIRVLKDVEIDEVVVSSPVLSTTFSELTRSVFVLSKDDFSHKPITTVSELLEQVSSIDIRQRGGHGVQTDLLVRGGSFDQVLILLNGINITDPQTGHHNLNIPIDIESIERVEVLHGPGARVYGPGAFSGAVNIITSSKGASKAKISAAIGEYGLIRTAASAGWSSERINSFVSVSSSKSDGYIQNTDFRSHNLFAHSSYNDEANSMEFQIGLQEKAFGANSFYTPKFPNQFEDTETFLTSFSYTRKFSGITVSPLLFIRQHNDRFELFRNNPPDWYKGHNYHSTTVFGSQVMATFLNSFGRGRVGVEFRSERISSNVLGNLLESERKVKGETDISYTHGAARNGIHLISDYTLYLKSLVISSGGQLTINDVFGTSLNLGVDASIALSEDLNLYSSVGNAIRYPTFTDLYYNGPTNFGNPNLKPERANCFELGARYSARNFNSKVTLFHRSGKDVIDWVKAETDTKWTTMNYTVLNTSGLELYLQLKAYDETHFFHSISLGYSYLLSEKERGELLSYYVLDNLKHKASVSISHRIVKNFSAAWMVTWQDRAGTYTDFNSGAEVPYKPFALINLRLNYSHNEVTVFVEGCNLANRTYFDIGNIPQPARWLVMGFSYNLN